MKKTLKVITLILMILLMILTGKVYATGTYKAEITGEGTVQVGNEITLKIRLKDLIDIGGVADGISVLTMSVGYDESKLEKISEAGLNGFSATWGSKLVLDKATGVKTDTDIAEIKFKVKNGVAAGDTAISLTGIRGSNGTENISTADVTKTISITTASTETPKSTNNFLSSLKINGTEITGFNKNTTTYSLTAAENNVTSLSIAATAEDSKASISGDTGTKTLQVGQNTFNVVVTAEDRSQKTYTISVERKAAAGAKSNNNFLSTLKIDGTEVSGFNKNTLTYTLATVANNKTAISISVLTEDNKATISGTGTKTLQVGMNTFNVVVTAEDGTQKTYIIKIERKAATTSDPSTDPKDPTVSPDPLAQTGVENVVYMGTGAILIAIGVFAFKRMRDLRGI